MGKVIFLLIFIFIVYGFGYQNMIIQKYVLRSSKINTNIRLAVISDLHGTKYGNHQERLIKQIKNQNPDAILLVGDLIDERCDMSGIEDLLKGIKTYSCFYVLGNHEISADKVEEINALMKKYHIQRISSSKEVIHIQENDIALLGIDDFTFYSSKEEFQKQFHLLDQVVDASQYSIMLSHRPYLIDLYKDSHFDLIVCGHAHGGQCRIPYILNGLYAPDEYLFPKYAGGQYDFEYAKMIVGRGLVRNIIPRFFNPPELVMIELKNN